MQDLTPRARFESDYDTEVAHNLNEDLGEKSDYVFVLVAYDAVYLCSWEDEGEWTTQGHFEDVGNDYHSATDDIEGDIDGMLIDIPGTDHERIYATEDE